MPQSISTIEGYLSSTNKLVRLKALKLLLRHPDASPIQLVRALCSDDNRDFEFLEVFELDYAMWQSWTRLRGVTDDEVYQYLSALYVADPARNINHVIHVLELLSTPKALEMLREIRASAPQSSHWSIEWTIDIISARLVSPDSSIS